MFVFDGERSLIQSGVQGKVPLYLSTKSVYKSLFIKWFIFKVVELYEKIRLLQCKFCCEKPQLCQNGFHGQDAREVRFSGRKQPRDGGVFTGCRTPQGYFRKK